MIPDMRKPPRRQDVRLPDQEQPWHPEDVAAGEARSNPAAKRLYGPAENGRTESLTERGAAEAELLVQGAIQVRDSTGGRPSLVEEPLPLGRRSAKGEHDGGIAGVGFRMPAQLRHALDAKGSAKMTQEEEQRGLVCELRGERPGDGIHAVRRDGPDRRIQRNGGPGTHLFMIGPGTDAL